MLKFYFAAAVISLMLTCQLSLGAGTKRPKKKKAVFMDCSILVPAQGNSSDSTVVLNAHFENTLNAASPFNPIRIELIVSDDERTLDLERNLDELRQRGVTVSQEKLPYDVVPPMSKRRIVVASVEHIDFVREIIRDLVARAEKSPLHLYRIVR